MRRLRLWVAVFALLLLAMTPRGHAQDGLVSREAWQAKAAKFELMRLHHPIGIMIHHTSVRQQTKYTLEQKMRGLQGFSQRPGRVGIRSKPPWGDVPYHFYVGVSGRVAEGRNLFYAGDTNTKYNTTGWIQVVLEGDFTREEPNGAQLAALERLTKQLRLRFNISGDRVSAHNDHAETDCPGTNLKKHIPLLRN